MCALRPMAARVHAGAARAAWLQAFTHRSRPPLPWILVEVPGLVLLPIWFALQFANGVMALESARGTEEVAGVAWWAHIGGFAFGLVAGLIYRRRATPTTPDS